MTQEQIDSMSTMQKYSFLDKLVCRVTYNGRSHLTPYRGAADLLEGRLKSVGVERDALAAVLRAFEKKCLLKSWHFPFKAGVITITKAEV